MKEIYLNEQDNFGFRKALDYCIKWGIEHQWEVGVAEMALGAAAIAWGVQSGAIEIGKDIVASSLSPEAIGLAEEFGVAGSGIGAIGGYVLGGIGVCAMGGAIGIPAGLIIGGGSVILGLSGYAVGDLVQKFISPTLDYKTFFAGSSVMTIGVVLLIDGASRVVKDQVVLDTASKFKDNVISFVSLTTDVAASSLDELKELMMTLPIAPEDNVDAAGSIVTSATVAAVGGTVGATVAASSVTVLGSHLLGTAALSLGIVSAPLWPVIACGTAGIAVGYTTWKTIKYVKNKNASNEVA